MPTTNLPHAMNTHPHSPRHRFHVTLGIVLFGLGASAAQFEDVTTSAGLTNVSGYCMGVAWGDPNKDGFLDLYLGCGGPETSVNEFYRNRGDGTFARVGAEAGPLTTDVHSTFGCAWIDFNNDGYRELFALNGGWSKARNDLYWNLRDGTFARGSVGALGRERFHSWFACADFDRDGWLDIYSTEADDAAGPFEGLLYRGQPDGTFTPMDIGVSETYLNEGVWGDFDNDGDLDLYLSNFTSPSRLLRNDGGGQFTPLDTGLPATFGTTHAAWADYDNDGDLDIALGSFSKVAVYRNDGAAGFVEAAVFSGNLTLPAWADYDNDGRPDLLAVGGQGITAVAGLFHNEGGDTFVPVEEPFTEVADYRLGCAWGDYDNDGFMDLAIGQEHGVNRLYHNRTNANHWLKVQLVGTVSNQDAIGAKVRVRATIGGQSVWQMQEVNGGYQIQNDLRLNFGLGDATSVDVLRIEWPSGNVTESTNVAVNQVRSINEVSGITPARPSASLNGQVTLSRSTVAGATYQWGFEGENLAGQTLHTLALSNLVATQQGRYHVVVSSPAGVVTNYAYLHIDRQFSKVTEGPVVTDTVKTWNGHFGDYDGDGLLDLLVLGDYFSAGNNTRLYRNLGQNQWLRVTNSPWGTLTARGLYSPWADVDNDGDLDVLLAVNEADPPQYLRNEGDGAFTVHPVDGSWTTDHSTVRGWSCAWADLDRDGLLDAILGDYPLLNSREGTFTPLKSTRIGGNSTHGYVWLDYDNDGDTDLFAPQEFAAARLYRNDHGQFTNVSASVLQGRVAGGLGGAFADFDNDGDLDLYWIGYNTPDRILINRGDGTFADWSGHPSSLLSVENGMPVWGDYDNDGWLDLYLAQSTSHGRLFRNTGDGNFAEIVVGSPVSDATPTGQSAAFADVNNDGALELFVACNASRNLFYLNNGTSNAWLKVRLQGTRSNRSGVGARLFATAVTGETPVRQRREITANSVLQELEAHFGLGGATQVELLRIEWPSGTLQTLTNVPARQILTVVEPRLQGAFETAGAFRLTVTCDTNRPYALDVSGDLLSWSNVTNFTQGSGVFTDSAPDPVQRYYRLR